MKKCPVCDKTFDDGMRFCQADGTSLVEVVEETPVDPYKTVVASQDEIASAIPPPSDAFDAPPAEPFSAPNADPFKTMVAGSQSRDESGDLLQLPEEYDPMKTAVVSQEELREQLGVDEPPAETQTSEPLGETQGASTPSSPFAESESPLELNVDESSNAPPEIPKFSEPSLNPPDFGDMSSGSSTESSGESIPTIDPFSSEPPPAPSQDAFSDSPFNRPNEAIPSPFGDAPKSFEPLPPPSPQYKEPEPPTVLGGNPFDQPQNFEPQQPANQSFTPPAQPGDWSPPPAPVSNWQEQGLGADTPFQPPAVTAQGTSQTLAIASLICGVIGLLGLVGLIIPFLNIVCLGLSPILAIAAIVTGFLARSRAKNNPDQYGGAGLALGGIITGALTLLAMAGLIILAVVYYSMGGIRF
jgi:hypothetical protein